MKAQELLFPNVKTCMEKEMFFRFEEGVEYFFTKDEIVFREKFSEVYFNTYFNSFSIGKWSKYTNIEKVFLNIKIKGKFNVILKREELVDGKHFSETINEEIVESKESKTFSFDFDIFSKTGLFYFVLISMEENSVYYGGDYSIETAELQKDVKFGVVICHFKKEAYIKRNMNSISDFMKANPEFSKHLQVFISDNSKTLNEKEIPYDFVHVFPNKNVGGSGGFARGMIEVQKANENGENFTHVLLMDDDLTFNPESIYRTYVFLSYLKDNYKKYFFSGLMNRLDSKNIQHENGALWNGGDFVSLKPNFDLNDFNNVLFNDCVDESVEFAPWWYCVIPIELTKNNLPMPVFYREDDSEYGMRNADGIISMNGICVWHEPFDAKFTPFVSYYHSRNSHIVNAVHHPEYGIERFLNYTLREVKNELRFLRYKIADLYLQAAEDFLKGITWLKNTDTVELHKKVTSSIYKLQSCEDIKEMPFIYGEYIKMLNKPAYPLWKRRVYVHICNDGYRFMKNNRDVWVPIAPGKVRLEMFAYAKRAYHYNLNMKKGFVTERSKDEYKRVMKRYNKLVKNAKKNYKKVVEEYRARFSEITSIEFWKQYLGV